MPKLDMYIKCKDGEQPSDAIMRMLSQIGQEQPLPKDSPDIEKVAEVPEDVYKPKTDKEIKELALQLYRGEIFTSLQLRNLENELSMVFMPIGFLDEIMIKIIIESKIGMFYSKMSSAAPRSINGYPIFFSVSYIDENDQERFLKKYNQVVELMEAL